MTESSRPNPLAADAAPRSEGGGKPRGRPERRRRRDFVTWLALGLLVVIVLAVVTRATTTRGRPRADALPTLDSRPRRHTTTRHSGATAPPPTVAGTRSSDPHSVTTPPTTSPTPASTTSTPPLPTTTTTTTTTEPAYLSTAPPPTTTPVTGQLRYSGTLSYPEDVATSIPFSSPSGVVAVRIIWSGGEELVASLRCRGAHDTAPGTHGISISIDGAPGACDVAVALGPAVRSRVAYAISVLSPGEG